MFTKIEKTAFPPKKKPLMVWDGECGFCKYWITHWQSKTANKVEYITFQEIASYFEDIPLKEFKKASRLIEPNGKVYSGPDSIFRVFTYFDKRKPIFHNWYSKDNWFTFLSDQTYNWIAKHRSIMFAITKLCFGKDPQRLKSYWFAILLFLVLFIFFVLGIL